MMTTSTLVFLLVTCVLLQAFFVAADMRQASKTMIQIYAVMAEWERDAIAKRTREALAAAKVRGVVIGAT